MRRNHAMPLPPMFPARGASAGGQFDLDDSPEGSWEGAGYYAMQGDDVAALMAGNYDVGGYYAMAGGDARADYIARLLQGAAAGYNPDVQRLLAASAGNAPLFPQMRQIAPQVVPHPVTGQPCIPGVTNVRPLTFPQLGQYSAASPVRGGFGAVPGMIPMRTDNPQEVRGSALGFDSVSTIAAAATANVITRPQGPFRPERLVVSVASQPFLINDVKVGNTSQLPAATSLPGDLFAFNAVGISQRWDTAQYGGDVLINVTNPTGGALRFVAAMVGTFLRP